MDIGLGKEVRENVIVMSFLGDEEGGWVEFCMSEVDFNFNE